MQGVFKIQGSITGITTAKTLCYIETHATRPIEIYSSHISCEDEDTSEQIYAELNRITTLGSPTGTVIVAKPSEEGSSSYSGICTVDVTGGEPTYDSVNDAIHAGGANKLGSWEYMPLPEERTIVAANDDVGLRLIDDLANASALSFHISFREIG